LQPEVVAAPKSRIRPVKIRQAAFLAAYAEMASVSWAAKASRISRDCHYQWLANDPEYVKKWEAVQPRALQLLLDEVWRRARVGVEEPVFYQGEICGTVQKYSDGLAQSLLRALDPRFREKTELSGPGGGPVQIDIAERLNAARKRIAAEPHAE
jgi:hypothetical protein